MPPVAILEESVAYSLGGGCYGPYNWQEPGQSVDAATYFSAAVRHLMAWFTGEQCDTEGEHPLGAARACLGILLDAAASGNLIDNRPRTTSTSAHMPVLQERLARVQEAIAARKAKAAAALEPSAPIIMRLSDLPEETVQESIAAGTVDEPDHEPVVHRGGVVSRADCERIRSALTRSASPAPG